MAKSTDNTISSSYNLQHCLTSHFNHLHAEVATSICNIVAK